MTHACVLVRTGGICTSQCCLLLTHDAEGMGVELDMPWHRLEVEYALWHWVVVVEDERVVHASVWHPTVSAAWKNQHTMAEKSPGLS